MDWAHVSESLVIDDSSISIKGKEVMKSNTVGPRKEALGCVFGKRAREATLDGLSTYVKKKVKFKDKVAGLAGSLKSTDGDRSTQGNEDQLLIKNVSANIALQPCRNQ